MAEPEVSGSKDLLRSFYYLYDKSPKFKKLFSNPRWQRRSVKKIEMVWVEGPTYRHYRGRSKPAPFVAASRLVGEDDNRIWRIEFNRHLMGQINENPRAEPPLKHVRPMTLEEIIAHEMAHFLFPAPTVGAQIAAKNELEVAVVERVNEIRRDLKLRERRITDPKDLKHRFQRAYHYNVEWDDDLQDDKENVHRTTGWRAHPFLAPRNYRTGPLDSQPDNDRPQDKFPAIDNPANRPDTKSVAGLDGSRTNESSGRKASSSPSRTSQRRVPNSTMHRLMSGDLSALDPQSGPFSPNLLRLLMGGNVPRVKGAARLEDIARPPAGRIGP